MYHFIVEAEVLFCDTWKN